MGLPVEVIFKSNHRPGATLLRTYPAVYTPYEVKANCINLELETVEEPNSVPLVR